MSEFGTRRKKLSVARFLELEPEEQDVESIAMMRGSDQWWSGPELTELAGLLFDRYLDPCACAGSPLTEGALHVRYGSHVRRGAPGYFAPDWPSAAAVVNPPWGLTGYYVPRLLHHAEAGHPCMLIAPLRLETRWARAFSPTLMLAPNRRLPYLSPETGEPKGTPETSTMIAFRNLGPTMRARAIFYARERGWTAWEAVR